MYPCINPYQMHLLLKINNISFLCFNYLFLDIFNNKKNIKNLILE